MKPHTEVTVWRGTYDDGWRDLIVPDAFAHPAKMARGLLERIIARLFELGLQKGDTILDPFGGIGTTAVIGAARGLKVICVELEPKFVALAEQNAELHRRDWEAMGRPFPLIVQGDSRNLRQAIADTVDAVMSSPPYAELTLDRGGERSAMMKGIFAGDTAGRSETAVGYGRTDGQLGGLPEGDGVEAVVASPPYAAGGQSNSAKSLDAQQTNAEVQARYPDWKVGRHEWIRAYGRTDGQMGILPEGDVDAVVSSPPYSDLPLRPDATSSPEAKIARLLGEGKTQAAETVRQHLSGPNSNLRQEDYGQTDGQLGQMPTGTLDAVVSSPPYAGNDKRDNTCADRDPGTQGAGSWRGTYGGADGQLARLASGDVDAVIGSPPYVESATGAGGLNTQPLQHAGQQGGRSAASASQDTDQRYGDSGGQMAKLPSGSVDAVVGSPPYDHQQSGGGIAITGAPEERLYPHAPSRAGLGYKGQGDTAGQLASLPTGNLDAIVSSPPYSESLTYQRAGAGGEGNELMRAGYSVQEIAAMRKAGDPRVLETKRDAGYSREKGNLGNLPQGEVDAVVGSPPFTHGYGRGGGINEHGYGPDGANKVGDRTYQAQGGEREPGNLETLTLGSVDAVVGSPPYANSELNDAQRTIHTSGLHHEQDRRYGRSDGQIGALDSGTVDAVISSPPYEDVIRGGGQGGIDWTKTFDGKDHRGAGVGSNGARDEIYGETPGQLAALPSGTDGVEAVLCNAVIVGNQSEDEVDGVNSATGTTTVGRGKRSLLASATKSPKPNSTSPRRNTGGQPITSGQGEETRGADSAGELLDERDSRKMTTDALSAVRLNDSKSITSRTTTTPAEFGITGLPISEPCAPDATSPYTTPIGSAEPSAPFAEGLTSPRLQSPVVQSDVAENHVDEGGRDLIESNRNNSGALSVNERLCSASGTNTAVTCASGPHVQHGNGPTDSMPETFWAAAQAVVRECYAILKPGGIAVWVVKAFVRNKQLVDFPGDWRKLCEHAGFVTVEEIHASLVEEEVHAGLFGDRTVRRERKSFFRRLAEKKGSPRIDHEVVWIMQKPS